MRTQSIGARRTGPAHLHGAQSSALAEIPRKPPRDRLGTLRATARACLRTGARAMMNLSPTELERLTIFSAAELARRYRSQGILLSHPEAVALITDEVLTAARRGLAHADRVSLGAGLLTADHVEPGVAGMIPYIALEAHMAQGTKLLAIFDPVKPGACWY
jgi:urease gamma subunit